MKPAGRFWPSNVRTQPVTVTGIDQRAQGIVGLIERMWSRGMNGGTGTIRIGNSSEPAFKWSGYTDYGTLAATSPIGASRNRRGDPNIALPGTGGPVIISATQTSPSNVVMNALAQQTPGVR